MDGFSATAGLLPTLAHSTSILGFELDVEQVLNGLRCLWRSKRFSFEYSGQTLRVLLRASKRACDRDRETFITSPVLIPEYFVNKQQVFAVKFQNSNTGLLFTYLQTQNFLLITMAALVSYPFYFDRSSRRKTLFALTQSVLLFAACRILFITHGRRSYFIAVWWFFNATNHRMMTLAYFKIRRMPTWTLKYFHPYRARKSEMIPLFEKLPRPRSDLKVLTYTSSWQSKVKSRKI